jgi:hypothetical protein
MKRPQNYHNVIRKVRTLWPAADHAINRLQFELGDFPGCKFNDEPLFIRCLANAADKYTAANQPQTIEGMRIFLLGLVELTSEVVHCKAAFHIGNKSLNWRPFVEPYTEFRSLVKQSPDFILEDFLEDHTAQFDEIVVHMMCSRILDIPGMATLYRDSVIKKALLKCLS